MTTRQELAASFEQLERTAMRVKRERDALYIALKTSLPQLEWANLHGSRSDKLLKIVREAIALAEGEN